MKIYLFLLLIIFYTVSSQTVSSLSGDYCELNSDRSECHKNKKCVRYNAKTFPESPSVVTYFPGGRLGNMLTAFLTLLWVKLDMNLDVYLEQEAHEFLDHYFEGVSAVNVLEKGLCNWKDFPFKKYEGDIELLGSKEWRTGNAVQIFIAKSNFMRHEIQGGRKYYKKYRKESMKALTFRPLFRDHVSKTFNEVKVEARKILDLRKGDEITFVGIHNRRTDYLEFRKKRLKLEELRDDYFIDAMEYYRDEYEHPVFLYVSDEKGWIGEDNMRKEAKDLFFVGCGDGADADCVGKDFAVLAACNHTITSHGSFGHWASYFAGGEIYTEYGAIVPDAYKV